MDRVQIVAYLPENYADFIHLFRHGWWENLSRAMILGITSHKFLALVAFTSIIVTPWNHWNIISVPILAILGRIAGIYWCYFKYEKLHLATDLKDPELKFYTQSPNVLLMAKLTDTQQVIGFISYIEMDEETVKMRRLNVHPDFRGLKLGWKLVVELMTKAKNNGYTKMYVNTSSPNIAAQKLYLKMGFQPLDLTLCFENTLVDLCTGLFDVAYIKQL